MEMASPLLCASPHCIHYHSHHCHHYHHDCHQSLFVKIINSDPTSIAEGERLQQGDRWRKQQKEWKQGKESSRGRGTESRGEWARHLILSLAPPGFSISLSACYNYTQNYRQASAQAERYHCGRGVNADLSLKPPPRTGVQLVVNLHWTTANVNSIINKSQELKCAVGICKDAEAIVPADIAPVQHPGPSQKKRAELPDHTWDRSLTKGIMYDIRLLREKERGRGHKSREATPTLISHVRRVH